MFCFKASVFLDELEAHAPAVATTTSSCWLALMERDSAANSMLEIPAKAFSTVPSISVDYAVMEHSDRVAVVPCDLGWNDIGSWNAVRDLVVADASDNRSTGDTLFLDCTNTYVMNGGRLVAAVGVDNLLIVDTPDALLVAHESKAQAVREVVTQLKARDHVAYKLHPTVARPWGSYTVLEQGARFKIKRISVKPGRSLSLQLHHHRSEHWIVVSGIARVCNGGEDIFVNTNESTYIQAGRKHRLENPGMVDLIIIEVQTGEYLGEDDIVRFEDVYGRVTGTVD